MLEQVLKYFWQHTGKWWSFGCEDLHLFFEVVGPLKFLVQSMWKKMSGELMLFDFRCFSFWWTREGVYFQHPLATEILLCRYSYLNEGCVGMTDLKADSHQNCLFKEMAIYCNVKFKKKLCIIGNIPL